MQQPQQDINLERSETPRDRIAQARRDEAAAIARVEVEQDGVGLVGGIADFVSVLIRAMSSLVAARHRCENGRFICTKKKPPASATASAKPADDRPVKVRGHRYHAQRNHQRDRQKHDLPDRFRQRRDDDRRQSHRHAQFLAHIDRHHELPAELCRRRHVVDRLAANSRGEQLEEPEIRRIVLDGDAPAERVRDSRKRLERNRERQAPSRHPHVANHLMRPVVGQEPGVERNCYNDENGLDAAHRQVGAAPIEGRQPMHCFSRDPPAQPVNARLFAACSVAQPRARISSRELVELL